MSQPTLRVRDILTKTWRSTEEGDNVMAEVGLVVKSEALNPRTSRVHYELLSPAGKTSATGYKDIKLNMRGEDTLRFLARIPDSLLWNPERPHASPCGSKPSTKAATWNISKSRWGSAP